jgi:hypothetical protein
MHINSHPISYLLLLDGKEEEEEEEDKIILDCSVISNK